MLRFRSSGLQRTKKSWHGAKDDKPTPIVSALCCCTQIDRVRLLAMPAHDMKKISAKNNDPYWYTRAFDVNGKPIARDGSVIKPGAAPRLPNGNPYGYDGYWTDPYLAARGPASGGEKRPLRLLTPPRVRPPHVTMEIHTLLGPFRGSHLSFDFRSTNTTPGHGPAPSHRQLRVPRLHLPRLRLRSHRGPDVRLRLRLRGQGPFHSSDCGRT